APARAAWRRRLGRRRALLRRLTGDALGPQRDGEPVDLRASVERGRGDHPRGHGRIRRRPGTPARRTGHGGLQGEISSVLFRPRSSVSPVLGAPPRDGVRGDPGRLPARRHALALPRALAQGDLALEDREGRAARRVERFLDVGLAPAGPLLEQGLEESDVEPLGLDGDGQGRAHPRARHFHAEREDRTPSWMETRVEDLTREIQGHLTPDNFFLPACFLWGGGVVLGVWGG